MNITNQIPFMIKLKYGRSIYTTHNGFRYWVSNKKNTRVDEITESQFNQNKKHRVK